MISTLKSIMKISGVASDEGRVAEYIEGQIAPYTDEILHDSLGNLIAVKRSTSPDAKKVMLCAHMDEIGFMVTYIEDSGFVRVSKVGGIDFAAYAFCSVVSARGVRGVLVPEGKVKPNDYTADKFYVDIGASDRREAERRVGIGDLLSVEAAFSHLRGKKYCGRPFDNRIGCVVLLEIARRLTDCKNDIYFVFSSQEEVGLRGATAATFRVRPDIGIAFDVTGTGDTIGCEAMAVKLGGGAAIKIKDTSAVCDVALVRTLGELAKASGIKHQYEVLTYGGTDTAPMQYTAGGARAAGISIPCRYIHTQNELIDISDAECCAALGLLACENV